MQLTVNMYMYYVIVNALTYLQMYMPVRSGVAYNSCISLLLIVDYLQYMGIVSMSIQRVANLT